MQKTWKTLYKIDQNGKLIFFNIRVVGSTDDGQALIRRKWGQVLGKHQDKKEYVRSGKNLGKANATTPYTQAISNAKSIYQEKLNNGYTTVTDTKADITVEELIADQALLKKVKMELPHHALDADGRKKPMLLKHLRLSSYKNGSNEWKKSSTPKYPGLVQPKRDGVCCLADYTHGMITRGGKTSLASGGKNWAKLCKHIQTEVNILSYPFTLHGEVYAHGHTLEEIKEACQKVTDVTPKLKLYIFDVVAPEMTMRERMTCLEAIDMSIQELELTNIKTFIDDTYTVEDEEDLLAYEDRFLKEGYEGIVFRGLGRGTEYKINGRSSKVLKLVRFDSQELEIVDILPMENDPDLGMFVVAWNDTTFNVTPGAGFKRVDRIDLLSNKLKYIGQMLTIEHRGYTNLGTPRIATGKAIRPANDL